MCSSDLKHLQMKKQQQSTAKPKVKAQGSTTQPFLKTGTKAKDGAQYRPRLQAKIVPLRSSSYNFGLVRPAGEVRTIGQDRPIEARQPEKKDPKRITEGPTGVGLSKCAFVYAKALANPFGDFDDLPCIPSLPAVETQKWRALTRGFFSTGTAGFGFVQVRPLCAANNSVSVMASLSTFAGSAYSRTAGATITSQLRAALPYTIADFDTDGNHLSARLVGLSLRIRNITQALNVGGLVIGSRLMSGEDLVAFTIANLTASPLTVLAPQTLDGQKDWLYMSWMPGDASDLTFPERAVNYTFGAANEEDAFSMGFFATAPSVAAAQTFEYEIMEFWEFSGNESTKTLPEVTRSDADPVGLARVQSAVCNLPNSLTVEEIVNDMATGVVESMAHSDTTAKTVEDLLGLAGMAIGPISKLVNSLSSSLLL